MIAVVCVTLGVLAAIGWRSRTPARDTSRADEVTASGSNPGRRALDVAAFRAQVQRLVERGKAIAGAKSPSAAGSAAGPPKPRGTLAGMLEPCVLGPAELCTLLAGLVDECDAGDGQTCLAIGQLLADTPPRPLIAIAFFVRACKAGEPTACERYEATRRDSGAPCEDDPFACGWLGYRSGDPAALARACALGVGDACSKLSMQSEADPVRAQGYLERACQLGVPMACEELGHRLSPDCAPTPTRVCYPPDPTEAQAALEIACAAGWQDACNKTP